MSEQVSFDPGQGTFRWDQAKFAHQLDVENRAKTDAAHGEPKDGAVNCQFLDDVRSAAVKVALTAKSELINSYKALRDATKPVSNAVAELCREKESALADMYEDCLKGVDGAAPLREKALQVQNEYRDFVVEHGIPGKTAKDEDKRAIWWVLVVAFLELILNAWTLGAAHPRGFLGVIPEMFLFTVVNVLIFGFLIADGWRNTNLNPRFSGGRRSGWVRVVSLIILVLLFNFVIGHYRDAMLALQQKVDAAGDYEAFLKSWAILFRTAVTTAFSREWIPQSMQTVVLIIAGTLMAFVAAYKWYGRDDPYPGFGPLSRKRDNARRQYVDEVNNIKDSIKDRADDAAGIFGSIETRSIGTPVDETNNSKKAMGWAAAYVDLIGELNTAGKVQLHAYRRANSAIKPWPNTLDESFESFKLDSEISKHPALDVECPREREDVRELLMQCHHVVLTARKRFASEVFAPLSAIDPTDPQYPNYADPIGKLDEIKRDLDGLQHL